jgi:hypothetical protein
MQYHCLARAGIGSLEDQIEIEIYNVIELDSQPLIINLSFPVRLRLVKQYN